MDKIQKLENQIYELKQLPKKLFKMLYWISIFLFLPTLTSYFVTWKWLTISRDIGIILLVFYTWKINKAITKKEKEDEVK